MKHDSFVSIARWTVRFGRDHRLNRFSAAHYRLAEMKPFTLSLAIMNGPIKITLIATMALTLFSSSGCMSMMARGITDSIGGDKSGIYPSRHLAKVAVQSPSWLTPLALIDLPLSLAVDTVLLPLDAARGRHPKMGPSEKTNSKTPVAIDRRGVVVSLRDTGGKRVLLVKVSLLRENDDDHKFPEVVDARAEALKAVVLKLMQKLTLEEANNPSTRTRMALELHGKLSDILGNAHPIKKNGVIFSEWITQ